MTLSEHFSQEADNDYFMANKWKLVKEFGKTRGLFQEHITSFDNFIKYGIREIVDANGLLKTDADPDWYFKYHDIRIGKPTIVCGPGETRDLYPFECRLRDLSYSAPITVDVEYVRGKEVIYRKNVEIGQMPIMLKSSHCHLYEKSSDQLIKFNECPLDPGGYFIINGVERVLLFQEQIINNRIMIEQDKTGSFMCTTISSTNTIKTRCHVIIKKGKIYLRHNTFTEDIPIMIILKGMGFETDQEVNQGIGPEEEILNHFIPSIEHCRSLGVKTSQQALLFISKRVKYKRERNDPLFAARDVLIRVVLPHIPVINFSFFAKGVFLQTKIRRLILAKIGKLQPDDRDYYGNKRIELPGSMVGLLFEDLIKRFNQEIKKFAERYIRLPTSRGIELLDSTRGHNLITISLNYALGTGNFKITRFNLHRIGVTQVLSRLSYISMLGMLTRINSLFEKTRKVSGPRSLQPSQWGSLCPSDTPEGEGCGLVKNLTLLSHITHYSDETPIINLLRVLGVESINTVFGEEVYEPQMVIVFLNGHLIGYTRNSEKLVDSLRLLRRRGKISPLISISSNKAIRSITVATDAGRLCRPYIIVKNCKPLVTSSHIKRLENNEIDFDYFIKNGLIEFLDVNELNDALIALDENDLTTSATHFEIAPFSLLGVCAGIIPHPNHNQSPRITYQCAMGKQAMGAVGYNQHKRVDNQMNLLVYPQAPLAKTKTIEMIGFDKLPAGQNAIVAVMSYSAYDIEDATIFNKASLDRSFGRCQVYKRAQVTIKQYTNPTIHNITMTSDTVANPLMFKNHSKFNEKKYRKLDDHGVVCVGEKVYRSDVLVNKISPTNIKSDATFTTTAGEFKDSPLNYKEPVAGVVDTVLLLNGQKDELMYKLRICQTRRPEVGDKFSSRHGQKGVIGRIYNQEDMPFTEEGICPDIIMNPHGFPSRMTVAKLIELLSGKSGLLSGEFKDATAFEKPDINYTMEVLQNHGYSYHGKEILMSGTTGEIIPVYIYIGPVFYQKLKHMVVDKMHARATGPKTSLTRQPVEGRHRGGGLRLGEMERDCLVGYGASYLLIERLMLSSDVCTAEICEDCGLLVSAGKCKGCFGRSIVSKVQIPYAFKLLAQELYSMNIAPRLRLRDKM